MRSVNIQTKKRQGDQTRTPFGFHWLLFALVFAAAALQVSPSNAHDGGPVSPTTPIGDVDVTNIDVTGGSPPKETLVKLVYKRCSPLPCPGPEVTQYYRLIEPVNTNHDTEFEPVLPLKAVVVLFTGGSGRVGFTDTSTGRGLTSSNFVIRQRMAFAASGPFVVAISDAARDFHDGSVLSCSTGSGLRSCRLSTEHLTDVANLVQDLKARFPSLPVWLVGTSRGTISAAGAAARLTNIDPANDDGLVLTATLTASSVHRDVFDPDAQLGLIDVPTLITSHEDDQCITTPPEDGDDVATALVAAPEVEVKLFDEELYGAISDECDPLGPHGFFGIEADAIEEINDFINDSL